MSTSENSNPQPSRLERTNPVTAGSDREAMPSSRNNGSPVAESGSQEHVLRSVVGGSISIASQEHPKYSVEEVDSSNQQDREQYTRRVAALGIADIFARRDATQVVSRERPDSTLGGCSGGALEQERTRLCRVGTDILDAIWSEGWRVRFWPHIIDEAQRVAAATVASTLPLVEESLFHVALERLHPDHAIPKDAIAAAMAIGRLDMRKVRITALANLIQDHIAGPPIPVARQSESVGRAMRLVFPYVPRHNQVEAVRHLLFERSDLILSAKTSFGKSTVIQACSLLTESVTLVVLPLNGIGAEQQGKIERLGGAPLALNADRRNKLTASELSYLSQGQYTHILLGPEEVTSSWFQTILAGPVFQKRVRLVVVDEFHLVEQWGSGFRKTYAQLKFLRTILPPSCNWFACSATLDSLTRAQAKLGAGFRYHTAEIRESTNRPEVFLRVATIPVGTKATFVALYGLIQNARSPITIPKTVVFLDSRAHTGAAAEAMKARLCSRYGYTTVQANETIGVIHSRVGGRDQSRVLEEFRKSTSCIRIVFATETMGTGVDIGDIDEIYQYLNPPNLHLAVLLQRGGRAARTAGRTGIFTLLVDPSYVDRLQDAVPMPQIMEHASSQLNKQIQRILSEEGASRIGYRASQKTPVAPDVDKTGMQTRQEIWTEAYNAFLLAKDCRRAVVARFFEDPAFVDAVNQGVDTVEAIRSIQGTMPCCDCCHPEKAFAVQPEIEDGSERYVEASIVPFIVRDLTEHARDQGRRRFDGSLFPSQSNTWYSNSFIQCTASAIASTFLGSNSPCLDTLEDFRAHCQAHGKECGALNVANPLRKECEDRLWTACIVARNAARARPVRKPSGPRRLKRKTGLGVESQSNPSSQLDATWDSETAYSASQPLATARPIERRASSPNLGTNVVHDQSDYPDLARSAIYATPIVRDQIGCPDLTRSAIGRAPIVRDQFGCPDSAQCTNSEIGSISGSVREVQVYSDLHPDPPIKRSRTSVGQSRESTMAKGRAPLSVIPSNTAASVSAARSSTPDAPSCTPERHPSPMSPTSVASVISTRSGRTLRTPARFR